MTNGKFFTAAYCPPYPPKGEYPNRITEKVYGSLQRIGIDNVFGHFEERSGAQYLEEAMRICDKLGITYFPRLDIFNQYLAITGGYHVKDGITYRNRPEIEKKAIGEAFLSEIAKVSHHPSFGGIYFGDEASYGATEGIAEAKALFKTQYPDKAFHYNNLNYCFSDAHLFGGENSEDYRPLTGDLECKSENRFRRYRYLIDEFVDKVHPEFLTTDFYPYNPIWQDIPTSVHRGLYELNALFADYKAKHKGLKSYAYVQTGRWSGEVRLNTRAEMALQINIILAYGHEGFAFFPAVYPNDFLGDESVERSKGGVCGLIDGYGNETMYADMAEELIADVQAFAPVIVPSEFLGVATVGEFHGGFDGVDLTTLPDYDCIYVGGLPEWVRYAGELPRIETTSQLFIGVFRQPNGKAAYYVVNNSVTNKARVNVSLTEKYALMQKRQTKTCEFKTAFTLPAGESAVLYQL